jgi:type IV fimbrial biogenesis protein FimT
MKRIRMTGFTLIELMVILSVVAIGLSFALPDMSSFGRRNTISSGTNNILGAISNARAEAVKLNSAVVVCASTNKTSCSAALTDWSTGLISFVDSNADGVRQSTEELISIIDGFPVGFQATSSGGTGQLRFAPNGLLSGVGIKIAIKHASQGSIDERRFVCVSRSGRAAALNNTSYTTDARFADCVAL